MKLRNILTAATAMTAMTAIAGSAFAQASATATAPSDAKIIAPITMTATSGTKLSFATIVKPSSGNSVVRVATNGTRSLVSGNATLAGGTAEAAAFTVGGEGASTFEITAANFNLSNGTDSLAVTPILSAATGTMSGTSGGTGTFGVTVGGDLALASTISNGAYSGTLSVTVAYN